MWLGLNLDTYLWEVNIIPIFKSNLHDPNEFVSAAWDGRSFVCHRL